MSDRHMKPPRGADGRELPPRAQPGYYPGYSTMAQRDHWDEATRRKIEPRLAKETQLRFFTAEEAVTLQALLDCVLPQSDRDAEHTIPVLRAIDARLANRQFDGYTYEGTPEADIAHRLGLCAVEATSREIHGKPFAELTIPEREAFLLALKDGAPPGRADWSALPPKYYFTLLVQDAVTAYYSHPHAWDEIGFGGPAYPRGYMRLTEGRPDPWEMEEARYDWQAPADSQSDTLAPNESLFPPSFLRKVEP